MSRTEAQLIDELRGRVTISFRQIDLAQELGITPQYLHDILKGLRPLSDRVAGAMGYERVVRFNKIASRKDQK